MLTKKFRWMGVLSGSVALGAVTAGCGGGEPGREGVQGADSGARPLPRTAPPSNLPDAGGSPGPDTEHRPDASAHRDGEDGGGLDDGGALATDGGDSAVTPACDPTTEDEPDDEFADTNCDGIDGDAKRAIFVANEGSDGAVGTRGAPVATLSRALELAAVESKDVYVCNGKYPEALRIEAPVRLYGGYACTREWKRVPDRALVEPLAGAALTVTDVEGPVVLDRLRLRAASVTEAGASSIGAVIQRSDSVLLSQLQLEAGDAGDGLDGVRVPDPMWTVPAPAADAADVPSGLACSASDACLTFWPERSDADCTVVRSGAAGQARSCPDGSRVLGGPGGWGGNCGLGLSPQRGGVGLPAGTRPGDSSWTPTALAAPSAASNGSDGPSVSLGFGRIVDGWYRPASGARPGDRGANGFSGTGGDGARSHSIATFRSAYPVGGGGGQGGYAGCGGPGGNPGTSGGASIGLLVVTSRVTVVQSRVLTARGGYGGSPSGGASGQPGGAAGKGGTSTLSAQPGQDGQPGGAGGDGGIGGAGAGGPSVGIVFTQLAPVVTDTAFVLGEPGLGGMGATAAADGLLAEIHDATSQYGVQP